MRALLLLLLLALVGVFVYSLVWAYADAEARGKPGWLVVLMVILLAWPGGLIVWVLIRPEDVHPTRARPPRQRA